MTAALSDPLQRVRARINERIDASARLSIEPSGDEAIDFFGRYCSIRSADARMLPLHLRPAQLEFHRDFTGRDIVNKARKRGISTYVAARFYKHVTTLDNVAAAVVAHKPDAVIELWRIVQLLHERDPRRPRTRYSSRRELVFPDRNSFFVVLQAGKGSGRAGTYNYLHVSELAHFDADASEVLAGMIAAVPQRDTGSEIVIESTSNGEGNDYHRRWVEAIHGMSPYAAHFFPWFGQEEYRRPVPADAAPWTTDEAHLARTFGLDAEQVQFRREMIADIGEALFRQEYPCTWQESFLSTGRKAFDVDALQELEAVHGAKPLTERVWPGTGYLRIWKPPVRGRRYVAGLDTAEGVTGGDAQDLRILDFETMEEVAALHGNWPIRDATRRVAALVREYDAFLVPEVNNHGHAFLEHFTGRDDELRLDPSNIYRRSDYDRATRTNVRKFGFETDRKWKPIMVATLEEAIRRRQLVAHDSLFYTEARAYAILDDQGYGAPKGMHDDSVMAMALALMGRRYVHEHD